MERPPAAHERRVQPLDSREVRFLDERFVDERGQKSLDEVGVGEERHVAPVIVVRDAVLHTGIPGGSSWRLTFGVT